MPTIIKPRRIVRPRRGLRLNRGHALARGLVGFWKGLPNNAGGSTLYDLSGYGNHGTLTNMSSDDWVQTERGVALDFDGTDDYVVKSSPVGLPTETLTYAIWAKFDNATSFRTLIATGTNNWYNGVWLAKTDTAIRFSLAGTTDTSDDAIYTLDMTDGPWYHLVGTYDGATGRIFVNGVEIHSWATTGTISTQGDLRIGEDPGALYMLDGMATDAHAYNRALSASEVAALYIESKQHYPNLLIDRAARRTVAFASATPTPTRRIFMIS